MINYTWVIEPDKGYYTLTIKADSKIINIVDYFHQEDDAECYAEAYIQGYKDARGEA